MLTLPIAVSFALLVGAMVLFALEIYPIDFVALAILAVVLVLAPFLDLTPQEVISGFSNPAAIAVLAMFILSGGVERGRPAKPAARRRDLDLHRAALGLVTATRFAAEGGLYSLDVSQEPDALVLPVLPPVDHGPRFETVESAALSVLQEAETGGSRALSGRVRWAAAGRS